MPQIPSTESTWTWIDKSGWGRGEWDFECDKYQWTDPDTNLACLIMRTRMGSLCGYVGVSEDHPLFGVKKSGIDFPVHCGISFEDFCQEYSEQSICHVPESGKSDKIFWFGFDCAHYCDLVPAISAFCFGAKLTYRNVEYVKGEVKVLADFLHKLKNSVDTSNAMPFLPAFS